MIFDIWALTLRVKRQSARISKITNDHLTQSGTVCFLVCGGIVLGTA